VTAQEQFAFVTSFNWDDPLEPIVAILGSTHCSLETALLAFWRLEGPWRITDPLSVGSHPLLSRWAVTVDQLARDIQAGRYRSAGIGYDAIEDNQLSRVQLHKLAKAGLPQVFLTRV
jgi:hypothetical protein